MAEQRPIYLDHNATTPLDDRVLDAMLPFLRASFGNAASKTHPYGWEAAEAVDRAREQTAVLIGASPKELVFTSGATEADNLALKGVAWKLREQGRHLITCTTEHKAVLDSCKFLEQEGFEVTYLPVDATGRLEPDQVLAALRKETILVSLMLANNEVGTLHPIAEIGALLAERGVLFHCDATQAPGKLPVHVDHLAVDLLSLSAHKFNGPKGIGALYVRRSGKRPRLEALLHGGGHERGLRSGTLNVPGIVGMGAAAELALAGLPAETARLAALRDRLEQALLAAIDETVVNGNTVYRLPNTSNISFAFIEGESLMMRVPGMAVSSGSACTSASLEPSYVLRAMGLPDEMAHCSIRFSLGHGNTPEQIDALVPRIVEAVAFLRELSPLYEEARKQGLSWVKKR